LTTPLEIGCDVRYEQTTSDLGTLTSTWLLGGVRAGVLPGWELTGTFSQQNTTGSEAGYNGTLLARYPYLYSNADLGKYSTFTVDGNVQSLKFSSVLQVTKNSTLYLDYDLTRGNIHPYVQTIVGTLENQYMEMTYEIKF